MRQSTLRLTQSQEVAFKDYLNRRLRELRRDNKDRIDADKESDRIYRLQREDRARVGTVFEKSNFPVPLISWVIDHFAARTEDEVMSRTPPAKFQPQGPTDDDLVRGTNRLVAYKLFE
ncbi:MAG: hypothetical protein HZA93_01885 [Verrucomicrobia bacterium]|nr:hypothetical protein [Verrucomicrobiota bacterium]